MAVRLPRTIIKVSAEPSPRTKVRPVRRESVRLPCVVVMASWTVALPASTSVTAKRVLCAVLKTRATFFGTVWAPGRTLTGASLTADTVSVTGTVEELSFPSFAR